ncbi:MAG: hypothetical protein ACFE9Z_10115 [Promethearchaeota archaeon]
MKIYNLTNAYIQRINNTSETAINISLEKFKDLEKYPFLLIIQSFIENSIKISIYPLEKDKITKITFLSIKFSEEIYDLIKRILQKFQVIHTSGVLFVGEHLYYECYLNLSLAESRAMKLNKTLENIKNIFKQIKIEEIGLIKS